MSVEALQQWASSQKLAEVEFANGSIKLGDVSFPIEEMVTVSVGDKSCQYTLGSIFLQVQNPTQSLVEYRKACKSYGVNDPVKASDKQTILSYFVSSSSEAHTIVPTEEVPADQQPAAGASEEIPTTSDEKKSHNEKKRDRKRESSGEHKHHRNKKPREKSKEPERREKKAHKPIDPEKLFSNLSVVVGKREIKAQRDAEQARLHAALSTDGFHVTAEELAKYKNENQTLMAHEIPVGDSSSILKAGAGKDLKRVLTLYNETLAASYKKASGSSSRKSPGAADSLNSSSGNMKRPYLIGKRPIIVLPKGMTAPITMVNAYDFFANCKFVPRDKMQKQLRTTHQQPKALFSRNVNARLGGAKLEYELMDNPKSKLHSSRDWERVVSVIALGQSWQMKDWPSPYNNPVELFGRTYGFYVGMEGDKVPTELQGWSVKQARLNRDKRGLDSVTYASFWNGLDEWMTIHRPELLPQLEE